MKFGFPKQHLSLGARAATLAVSACLAACGGSSSNGGSSGTTGSSGTGTSLTDGGTSAATSGATVTGPDDSGPGSTVATEAGAGCANPTVQIDFSPMYSAFITGENPPMHNFQVPAVTDDGNAAVWSASDPTQVVMVAQTFGTNPALPGVMITLAGPGTGATGQVTIYATEADGSCGASVLTITPNTEDDWQIGNARYNDGVTLTVGPGGGGGMMFRPDAGFMVFQPDAGGGGGLRATDGGSFYERDGGTACTNCHGPTATSGPYRDVSHTPEQTGGFSDQELIGIFTGGMIPDGGYFDPSVITSDCDGGTDTITVPEEQQAIQIAAAAAAAHTRPVYPLGCMQANYETWHAFHQWTDIDTTEQPGVICYLRALQPEPQNGTSAAANFGGGGRGPRDGGARGRPDGGFGRMPDAAP